jgi:hypothetical protein
MAVWSYSPQEALTESVVTLTTVSQVSPGSAVTGQPTPATRRVFRLRYSLVDTATVNSMAAFFTAQQGPWLAFDYWHVGDQQTHRVRFDDAMTIELFQPGLARLGDVVLVSQVGS